LRWSCERGPGPRSTCLHPPLFRTECLRQGLFQGQCHGQLGGLECSGGCAQRVAHRYAGHHAWCACRRMRTFPCSFEGKESIHGSALSLLGADLVAPNPAQSQHFAGCATRLLTRRLNAQGGFQRTRGENAGEQDQAPEIEDKKAKMTIAFSCSTCDARVVGAATSPPPRPSSHPPEWPRVLIAVHPPLSWPGSLVHQARIHSGRRDCAH